MSKLASKLPLIIFIVMAALFLVMLLQGKNPAVIDSALIGKPAPAFNLPPALQDKAGFTMQDLKHETVIVNFFASWCVECRGEQEALADIGIPVYGIAYKDTAEKLGPWLKQLGDPYIGVASDRDGRAAIDWGVYGVPETFIIDKGIIRQKIVGAVTAENLREALQQ